MLPKWLRILILVTAVMLVAGLGLLAGAEFYLLSQGREYVIEKIEERFDGRVEMGDLSVSFFPWIRIEGENLKLYKQGLEDFPPFISVEAFTAHLYPWGALRNPVRVESVELEGLEIHIPPDSGERSSKEETSPESERENPASKESEHSRSGTVKEYPFVIQELAADGTRLHIHPREQGKDPMTWEIYRLAMQSVSLDLPMNFQAHLKNAKPPGLIDSTGSFGPWNEENPGETPVRGHYTFDNADLSVFQGIGGQLSSQGEYSGILQRIEVQGWTDTPDFMVSVSGRPVHLRTDFEAVVDGTNGDTLLEPVKASFRDSVILARGRVSEEPGTEGKTVRLDIDVSEARVEDLLQLALRSDKPPLVGGIRFQTQFVLPPREQDIVDRLQLQGNFELRSARFTDFSVQEKLGELSRRAQGKPGEERSDRVVSNMKGDFRLREAVASFSNLEFTVPGAQVLLDGNYSLHPEELDFRGELRMEARLSQTTTGIKSFLLKVVDPFFSRDGAGAVLPIKVSGTMDSPSFGADF